MIIVISLQTHAQFLSDNYFTKLEVPSNLSAILLADTVFIDTLILHNGSSLKFTHEQNFLAIDNAYIGNNCFFNASGDNGKDGQHGKMENQKQGKHGTPGKQLTLLINFQELGSLDINSNGGSGGNGGNARGFNRRFWAAPTIFGRDGGNGGNGADGGHISIYYHSPNFTTTFNTGRRHSVNLSVNAGRGGDYGLRDRWRRTGAKNGGLGGNGRRGTLLIKRMDDWVL